MKKFEAKLFESVFFFFCIIILVAFFLVTFFQGIIVQFNGNNATAFVLFFISLVSLGTSIWIFFRAKYLLDKAREIKEFE